MITYFSELISPDAGTPLGHNVYKIRLAIKSKGKGKRGGARVITYLELGRFLNKAGTITQGELAEVERIIKLQLDLK